MRTYYGGHSHADFSKAIAALKIDILKNEKHFIITTLRDKFIFEKIRKILESGFSRNPDFSGFFSSKSWAISCRFRKSKLYKNLLRIGGGDSKYTHIRYTYTHNVGNLYINEADIMGEL